jgi:hypothetical protein
MPHKDHFMKINYAKWHMQAGRNEAELEKFPNRGVRRLIASYAPPSRRYI